MMKLRSGTGYPPGGYQFSDTRGGKLWDDCHTTFDERVAEVIKFRSQNPKLYPLDEEGGKYLNRDSVAQEITTFNCSRLGNNPNFCFDGTSMSRNVNETMGVPFEPKKCECGTVMLPRLSACCGGKQAGWDCPSCKKQI